SPSSYPPFDPHITLASLPSTTGIGAIMKSIPRNQPVIPVSFQSVEAGDHYFRSVYAAIKPSAALSALHAYIHKSLALEPKTPKFPHLSLFYIDDSDAEERLLLVEELSKSGVVRRNDDGGITLDPSAGKDPSSQLKGFTGSEIWVAECDGPVPGWRVIETICL
ncbi:hypothetical protein JAAARDRAFT_108711, partial [Jaapia argillacea MUCL 33604]